MLLWRLVHTCVPLTPHLCPACSTLVSRLLHTCVEYGSDLQVVICCFAVVVFPKIKYGKLDK